MSKREKLIDSAVRIVLRRTLNRLVGIGKGSVREYAIMLEQQSRYGEVPEWLKHDVGAEFTWLMIHS